MKKIGRFWWNLFGSIIGAIIALIFGVVLIFLIPFDFLKYRRSFYYKTFRKKYRFFDAVGPTFEMYNIVLKQKLPISYIENPENDSLAAGWFVIGQTLLADGSCCEFDYDFENGIWLWKHTDEEGVEDELPLEELLAMEVDGANCQAGRKICVDAVLLIDSDSVDPVELALQDKRFLIFDDKETALLQLVEDRRKVENDG
ncbi:MAG: hypothetical protein E7466_06990 [Ruminococcaceae bacterium]|nr:hypothetical protein [Oscillospiraceae bacterium]